MTPQDAARENMDDVTLYCGDCAQVMREHIPDGSIDLTVTSPPYDNLRTYKGYTFDFKAIAQQLWRVTKPGGVVVWVVADATINGSETGTSFRQALYFMGLGFNLYQTLHYHKDGPPPKPKKYEAVTEYMFVLSKDTPNTINLLRDKRNRWAGTSNWGQKTVREVDGRLTTRDPIVVQPFGKRTTIWRYTSGGIDYGHPAPFPEALANDHIASWSNPGDVVLDPMMGSGTTGKMAVLAQRRFIGIDIAAEYVALARERIASAQAQPHLIPFETQRIDAEQAQLQMDV